MVEYGTDSIQPTVNLYPRFNGKDKTQFLEYKEALRQPVVPSAKRRRHSSGRADADNRIKFAGRGDVDAREREPFRHLVLHDGAFCPQCREKAHGQDLGGWGR